MLNLKSVEEITQTLLYAYHTAIVATDTAIYADKVTRLTSNLKYCKKTADTFTFACEARKTAATARITANAAQMAANIAIEKAYTEVYNAVKTANAAHIVGDINTVACANITFWKALQSAEATVSTAVNMASSCYFTDTIPNKTPRSNKRLKKHYQVKEEVIVSKKIEVLTVYEGQL